MKWGIEKIFIITMVIIGLILLANATLEALNLEQTYDNSIQNNRNTKDLINAVRGV